MLIQESGWHVIMLNLKAMIHYRTQKTNVAKLVKTMRAKYRHFLTLFLSFSLRLRNPTDKTKNGV